MKSYIILYCILYYILYYVSLYIIKSFIPTAFHMQLPHSNVFFLRGCYELIQVGYVHACIMIEKT